MSNDFIIGNYRHKQFNTTHHLITTDHGTWIFLDKNEFLKLTRMKIEYNSALYKKLYDKGILIDAKNLDKISKEFRERYVFLLQGPSLHIVVPTLRCNLNCVYCHASSKPINTKNVDMTEKMARKTVDFIFNSPSYCITIEFQGGEPLLNWPIVEYIIKYAKEKNKKAKKDLKFDLVTNLCFMDNTKLDFLINNKVGICTSLDGPEILHNLNRPYSSYQYIKKWIPKITEAYLKKGIKDMQANALITVTKHALPKWKEIIDEYISTGFKMIHLRFLNNLGDARPAWKQISYSPEEFIGFWNKSTDYINEINRNGFKIQERGAEIIRQKITSTRDPCYSEMQSPCGAAISQLLYNYNGDIYTCDEARMLGEDIFKLGNIEKNKYEEVLTCQNACSVIVASINDTKHCETCVYKPYCGLCPVCSYVEQGTTIPKITSTARCKIFKAQFDRLFKDELINTTKNDKNP